MIILGVEIAKILISSSDVLVDAGNLIRGKQEQEHEDPWFKHEIRRHEKRNSLKA